MHEAKYALQMLPIIIGAATSQAIKSAAMKVMTDRAESMEEKSFFKPLIPCKSWHPCRDNAASMKMITSLLKYPPYIVIVRMRRKDTTWDAGPKLCDVSRLNSRGAIAKSIAPLAATKE